MTRQDIVQWIEGEIAAENEDAVRFPPEVSRKLVADAIKEVAARHEGKVAGFAPYGLHEWKIEYAR